MQASALADSTIGPLFQLIEESFSQPDIRLDVVRYPNAFFGVQNTTFLDSAKDTLSFVDGGEDGEIIPIQPLLVKARGVDVIIAIDAVCQARSLVHATLLTKCLQSGNTTAWADGSSIIVSPSWSH